MQCDLLNDNSCNGPAKFNSIIFNKYHLLVILSVCYYKTHKLRYVNVKSTSIQAEMCTPYPTFYSIQLVAHHLLRHKGRHVGFVATCCWC